MRIFYNIGIWLLGLAVKILSLRQEKSKKWIDGRRDWQVRLQNIFSGNRKKVIWFHCASLGEFEQGRPLIEEIKKSDPEIFILLTFFSPSGYEIRKNYSMADAVTYLPLDTPAAAAQFIDIVNPSSVVFVKYEFWLNLLRELRFRNIPHYLISAVFHDKQPFFKWYGGIFRAALNGYTRIFTQDVESKNKISSIRKEGVIIAGDTRFDRVHAIASNASDIPVVRSFKGSGKLLVAGSTWPEDETRLLPLWKEIHKNGWKLLIAPHEIGEHHILKIESTLISSGVPEKKIVRYSRADESSVADADVLIIDNIGMLASVYKYSDISYIGGGFGKSIHNTLEAAVYGCPVVFGPAYRKFNEAHELIATKGGFGVHSGDELKSTIMRLVSDEGFRQNSGSLAGNYVRGKLGATQKILSEISVAEVPGNSKL